MTVALSRTRPLLRQLSGRKCDVVGVFVVVLVLVLVEGGGGISSSYAISMWTGCCPCQARTLWDMKVFLVVVVVVIVLNLCRLLWYGGGGGGDGQRCLYW